MCTTTFKSSKKQRHAIICLREDGTVDHVYSYIMGYAMEGNPKLLHIINNVFDIILADDVETFKKMVRFLEGKNSELCKKGKEKLEEMKELYEREAKKYTLCINSLWER